VGYLFPIAAIWAAFDYWKELFPDQNVEFAVTAFYQVRNKCCFPPMGLCSFLSEFYTFPTQFPITVAVNNRAITFMAHGHIPNIIPSWLCHIISTKHNNLDNIFPIIPILGCLHYIPPFFSIISPQGGVLR
jgi:hypothetical protein